MYTSRPADFAYHRAGDLAEAVMLLSEDGDARALAGGHSLLPLMKCRLVTPAALVDIGGVAGLADITEEGGSLRVGALATHASVAASALVRERCPLLAETAARIGDPQVRNRGTIGGSLGHADPGADYPTVVTALDGKVTVTGSGGEREIAAADLVVGVFTTSLERGELITSVTVPATAAGSGGAYVKHKHPASGYAVAAAAALVTVEGGSCTAARLVVGGVTGVPEAAEAAAAAVVGAASSDDGALEAAGAKVAEALSGALDDTYASGEYRVHLAGVLAQRALREAMRRAG